MNIKRRIAAALAATVMSIGVGASAASADVCANCNGATIANWTSSSGAILINNGSTNRWLYQGQWSASQTNWKDVDAFYLPKCAAQHYNVSTHTWGAVFYPKTWYYIPDTMSLSLRVAYC